MGKNGLKKTLEEELSIMPRKWKKHLAAVFLKNGHLFVNLLINEFSWFADLTTKPNKLNFNISCIWNTKVYTHNISGFFWSKSYLVFPQVFNALLSIFSPLSLPLFFSILRCIITMPGHTEWKEPNSIYIIFREKIK